MVSHAKQTRPPADNAGKTDSKRSGRRSRRPTNDGDRHGPGCKRADDTQDAVSPEGGAVGTIGADETSDLAIDPRTIRGALVRVPSGDRAYVEGIDPKDPRRVLIKYEAVKFYGQDPYDSYPLPMLTLVFPSLETRIDSQSPVTDNQGAGRNVAIAPLSSLISEINALYGQLEEAEEVATNAAQSALNFALEMGDRLLTAKKSSGHGNWEKVRSQIKSLRSGKPLPSSTATLYQRMAKRRGDLEEAGIQTLRAAAEFLKGDRQGKSATPTPSAADLPEDRVEGKSGLKESDENYSPPELVEPARQALGAIDLDPASCTAANETVKASCFYSREDDGLVQPWSGRVWLNSPYSYPLIQQFSDRLLSEWEAGNLEAAIAITNNATDTAWHQSLSKACTVRLDPKGRYQFHSPYRQEGSNRQGQTLFYFGTKPERFYKAFEGKGVFYPPAPATPTTSAPTTLPIYKSTLTAEEFAEGMRAVSQQFSGCLSCKNHVLNGDGSRYWCEMGEFDDTLPLKYNWMNENEGICKSYSAPNFHDAYLLEARQAVVERQLQPLDPPPQRADTRNGMPAIQKAVWEWLNLHCVEVDENAANDAAGQIYEFLQGQFLEVMDDG